MWLRGADTHDEGVAPNPRGRINEEDVMSEPFIFIGTHRVHEGRLQEFQEYFSDFCDTVVRPNEPRLLSFHGYVDERAREVTVVQVHPDAGSMLHHMSVITEHIDRAYADFLEPRSRFQVYGVAQGRVLEMVRQMGRADADAVIVQQPFAGFERLPDV